MIVCEIKLVSARGSQFNQDLGTLVIDNITTVEAHEASSGKVGDYRCRMYRKGCLERFANWAGRMVCQAKPTREAEVRGHRRLAEPVQNLVAKALKELGYG